jgi:hypothetical protein
VAAVRALLAGWQPLGDNGILLVRARDVGTAHHPLLGSWTSASLVLDTHVNNPGPLYFDAVAPTIKLFGPWVGLALGVMLVNMAASSLAVVMARRLTGTESMVAAAVVVVGLQWALGSALLFDIWQPNALVLPFFAFLIVITVLATGDLSVAPWAVGIGSLVVQTHMSHIVLVAVLSLLGTALGVWAWRRRDDAPSWRRPLLWAGVVAALAWAQPVYEQFTSRGEGNLSRILEAATSSEAPPIGWDRATRLIAEITTLSPWFTRASYADAVPPTTPDDPIVGIVGVAMGLVTLALVAAAVVAVTVWAARSGRRSLATMVGVSGVALATAYVALAISPVNHIAVALHQMRWLWPIAALVTAAGLTALFTAARARPGLHRGVVAAGAVVALVVAVANLPTHVSEASGPNDTIDYLDSGRELMGQLGVLEGRGTVLYDPSPLLFAEPYSGMTFAEMQDRGIPFVFDDEGFIRQFGEGRRNDGDAVLRLWQVEGSAALEVPPGAERVALTEGPSGPVALFVEPVD